MTQEEKAKRYDDALEIARKINSGEGVPAPPDWTVYEVIFPELKESEDERVRKAILTGLIDCRDAPDLGWNDFGGIVIDDCIAWLEKQEEKDKLIQELGKYKVKYTQEILNKHLENQEEQKSTNKVEPKFKVGDWIISNNKKATYQVIEVKRGIYVIRDNADNHEYHIGIEECEKSGRLWNISDAKDGDVLACNEEILLFKSYSVQGRISLYCWYNCQTNNFHSKEVADASLTTRNKICPATKEQRDLLFQKMHEAGYEWDKEKKELRKIEKQGEKPTLRERYENIAKSDWFKKTHEGMSVSNDEEPKWGDDENSKVNDETNAPTGYGKYVDECLNEASKHFFSEGEDKYTVADLFYAGVRCGKSWFEKQGKLKWTEEDEKRIDSICNFVWKNRKGDTDEIYQQEQDVNWLKSIKQRI